MAEATNNQMTGAEEDDYMGDLSKFLPPEAPAPSKSSKKVFTTKNEITHSSRNKPKTLSWQEQRKLKRDQKQAEEDKETLENLQSAIPQSNIGFKLLKQMGYTPGSALGKEGSGLAEPVGLEIRRTRAGIGKEDPRKEKMRREEETMERKRRKEEELMADFGWRQKEQWRGRRVVVNYYKAKAVLEQLENKEVVVAMEEEEEEKDEEEDENDEEEEEITEEDLLHILLKLREEYQYCLFCGCRYESIEALLSECPGLNEDDH